MNNLSEISVKQTPAHETDNRADAIKLIELAIAESLKQKITSLEIVRDVLDQVELTKSASDLE